MKDHWIKMMGPLNTTVFQILVTFTETLPFKYLSSLKCLFDLKETILFFKNF